MDRVVAEIQSWQIHQAIADTTPDFHYAFDLTGRFIFANRRLLEVWGVTLEQALGKSLLELGYPQWHAEMHLQEIAEVIRTRQPIKGQVPFTGGSGISGVYEYIFSPAFGANGDVEFITGTTRDVSDRERAEQGLRDNEKRFRLLADSMPEMAWVTGPGGAPEYFNRRWYQFTGLQEDSVDVARWSQLLHPEDQARVRERYEHSLRTGEPYQAEYRMRHHSGQYRWTLGRALPARNERGQIERWYGTSTDIHDQKLSEEQLRQTREQTELVVKGANVGVWFCPLPFDRLSWDEKVKEHFFLPTDAEVTIDLFYERLHPADRERVRQAIDQSVSRRESYDIEYRTVSPDGGQTKWIRAVGRGFYDADGHPTRFDGITLDMTERKRTEERAHEESTAVEIINRVGRALTAELNLEKLVQTITDATTQLTGAQFGAFFYNVINEQGNALSLYALSGVDKAHFDKFPMPRMTKLFEPTFTGRGTVRSDDITQDPRYGKNAPYAGMPKGHLPVRSYLTVPVIARSGEVLGSLFFGHSLAGMFSERSEWVVSGIAAQAAVAIDNARLFDATKRANAEKDKLLQRERAARTEVEVASQMKDEFLATLSHELRTPLNAILGWSQLLSVSNARQIDLHEGLATIERNARAQAQIIEDLLDMSRIISGKIRLEVSPIQLAEIIKASVDSLRPTADAKGVGLVTVLDTTAAPISGDPNRLQQVMWNLLTNAIKFTPRGGSVQVLLKPSATQLDVSVVDTGEGIDADFLPHVFDRFRQSDSSTTRRHGGLGLGLAIVKQLVELHGGTIYADSAGKGRGATFRFTLPSLPVSADAAETSKQRAKVELSTPISPQQNLNGSRLLVVDDEADARTLMKRLFEDRGARVTLAANAEEAFQHLTLEPPDVLISDIGMPAEDGYSLLRRIRSLPAERGGETPAIALTAYARVEDQIKAVSAGFQHHLDKPVDAPRLIQLVASLARLKSAR